MVWEAMTLDYITTLTNSGESEALEFKAKPERAARRP